MKKAFPILLFLIGSIQTFAQGKIKESLNSSTIASQSNLRQSGIMQTFDERYDGVRGNRYFYDGNFHDGEIWMNNDRHYKDEYKYRLDQVAGTIEAKGRDGKVIVLNNSDISAFDLIINDKKISFSLFKMPKNQGEKLLQVIYYSPTLAFLRDSKKVLKRVNDTGAYSKGEVYDEIEEEYQYYLSRKGGELVEVKPTRKSLSKAMPDKESKIEKLFSSSRYKRDLTISLISELMKELDEQPAEKSN